MKVKMIFLVCFITMSNLCISAIDSNRYDFENFKKTNLWPLANAVRADNSAEVKELLKDRKIFIDLRDPKFQQTLLTLSILNKKRNAFIALLQGNANPNLLLGEYNETTPFLDAIASQDDCNLFYIENLVKFGADINLVVRYTSGDSCLKTKTALLMAIGQSANNGRECLTIIKFLVNHGAEVNFCVHDSFTGICEGVISKCLLLNSLEILKYFIVEEKIAIPDKVYAIGALRRETMKVFGLEEILHTKAFQSNIVYLADAKDDILEFIKEGK